jgi:hypothetical protein
VVAVAVSRGRPFRRRFPQSFGGLQAAQESRFMLHDRTMIRHASRSGTVTAISLGVHGACRAGLFDSVGEPPFACRGGLVGHRFPCSKSGLGRTADRQEPDDGNQRKEKSDTTLRQHLRQCMLGACESGSLRWYVPAILAAPRGVGSTIRYSDVSNDWLSRPAYPVVKRFCPRGELP